MVPQGTEGRENGGKGDALERWVAKAGGAGDRDSEGREGSEKDDSHEDEGKNKPSPFAKPWVKIAVIILVLALVIGAVIWWLIARQYETTDDAFIDTHIVHVSPQIAGQVLVIHVSDNQMVRAGQPLADIDARPQQAALEQALSQRLQALTQVEQAQAQMRGAQAQVTNTSKDLARYHTLQSAAPQAVAQQQVDQGPPHATPPPSATKPPPKSPPQKPRFKCWTHRSPPRV
jgi:membrane fusion protein (multidrug efflux system)